MNELNDYIISLQDKYVVIHDFEIFVPYQIFKKHPFEKIAVPRLCEISRGIVFNTTELDSPIDYNMKIDVVKLKCSNNSEFSYVKPTPKSIYFVHPIESFYEPV